MPARHDTIPRGRSARPLLVGLTGGIGSGKSLVAETFSHRNIPVLSTDLIAKEIAVRDAGVRRRLQRLLGPEAYRSDGTLDRKRVAQVVFSRPIQRKKMERIVHPAVIGQVLRQSRSLATDGHPVVVVEAALIYESGMDRYLDAVVVVDAPVAVRLKRTMLRDGATAADVRRRMAGQRASSDVRKKADIILRNTGTKSLLRQKARFLASLFRTWAEERKGTS